MEGKLFKEEEGYYLIVNTVIIGTTRALLHFDYVKYKLSTEQCEYLGECNVEVEMIGPLVYHSNLPKEGEERPEYRPKLDAEGCLILKRIK